MSGVGLDLSTPGLRESMRTAVAFARSTASLDLDGAWSVWRSLSDVQRMQLAIALANLLDLALPTDGDWADILAMVEVARFPNAEHAGLDGAS